MFESLGKLVLYLLGDSTSYTKMLQNAQRDFKSTVSTISRDALLMTAAVVAPLLSIGAVSTKASMDFGRSMATIVGLVGIARTQVDAWSKDLLSIAPRFGKDPEELAKGLYFISSAGFKGADAMEVLKVSSMGAAAGLGTVKEVAFATVSAVNAYKNAGLTAIQVTDMITAAAREGHMEAADLARVIGSTLPLAAAMKLPLQDLLAGVASLTRIGASPAQAIIGIQGVLKNFEKPTVAAKKALAGVGLDFATLRDMIKKPGGLLNVLLLLHKAMDKPGDLGGGLAEVFGEIRPLRAALGLLVQDTRSVRDVFDSVGASAGSTQRAFDAIVNTPGFKLEQMLTRVKVLLIGIGDAISKYVTPNIDRMSTALDQAFAFVSNFKISSSFNQLFNTVEWKARDFWTQVQQLGIDAWSSVMDFMGTNWDRVSSGFVDSVNVVRAAIADLNIEKTVKWLRELVFSIGKWVEQNAALIGTIAAIAIAVHTLYFGVGLLSTAFTIFTTVLGINKLIALLSIPIWLAYNAAMAAYSVVSGVATTVTWLLNAALTAMHILLSPVELALAAVTLGLIVGTFIVLTATVWSAYHAIKDTFTALMDRKILTPLESIKAMFVEWRDILRDVFRAAKTDGPLAWEILKKGFELAVEQMKEQWPPLWAYIKGGFKGVWELTAAEFQAVMFKSFIQTFTKMVPIVTAVNATAGLMLGDAIKGFGDNTFKGLNQDIADAQKKLDDLAKTDLSFKETDRIKQLRKELDELRSQIKEPKKWAIGDAWVSTEETVIKPVRELALDTANTWNHTLAANVKPLDAVLFNSAEARARIREHMAIIRGESIPQNIRGGNSTRSRNNAQMGPGSAKPQKSDQTQSINLMQQQNQYLKQLLEEARKGNKPKDNKGLDIGPINIKG